MDFLDAWNELNDDKRSLLLEQRCTEPIPRAVARILAEAGLIVFAPAAPAHWPPGLRDFLDDVAAVRDDDPECE
ncbi:hypothetical protein [Actinoplanes sp. NPDC051494]|uniref:hypothetical protein n=1 Tax=Actinoplanes sp. NPDC051494 TaxID=3363907 RepID=UPI0037B4AA01